jgi:aldehyde:ferredoxin oxidoreductase
MDFENRLSLFDTLILCRFYRDFYLWDELVTMISAATGISEDKESLTRKALNVADLVRWFNIREGLTKDDDTLPRRIFHEKLEGGQGITEEELFLMRADYYRLHGWDQEGRPYYAPPCLDIEPRENSGK